MFSASTVFSADNDPVTVTSILKAAKCPLTKEQQKTIADIKPGEGMRELFQTINEMFTEEQMKALKEKLGVMPSRNERPERPRSLFQLIILEKEKVPLTEKQVNEIKNMTMERGGFRQMNEMLTDAQREAFSKYMGNRGGGRGNR